MIFISGKIFLIYIRNKIGDTGDPCEMPILTPIFSCLLPSNASCKCLPERSSPRGCTLSFSYIYNSRLTKPTAASVLSGQS